MAITLLRFFIILSFFLGMQTALAQDSLYVDSLQQKNHLADKEFSPHTSLGLVSGLNFCRVNFDVNLPLETLQRPYIGLAMYHRSSERMGVKIQLGVSGKGWKEVYPSGGQYTLQSSYAELQFLTSIRVGKGKLHPCFDLGPYLAYLVSEKKSLDLPVSDGTHYTMALQNKLDFGLVGAAGLQYDVARFTAGFNAKVLQGLTSIFETDPDQNFAFSQNQVLQVSVFLLAKF